MRILADRERCAGQARCVATAPDLVHLDDDGYIAAESFEVATRFEELARQAVAACPERALRLVDS